MRSTWGPNGDPIAGAMGEQWECSVMGVMGDVAGFTNLGLLPEPCGENPPLLNGLQNTCLLNT